MVQRYRPDELEMVGMHPESDGDYVDYADYTAIERERDELQAKVIEQDDKLCKAEKRLEVACHVKADDKVGFDFAVLDKIDSLERERDELQEELRKWRDSRDGMMSIVEKLEADNALLRKQIEEIEESRDEWRRQWYLSEAGLSAAEKEVERLRKRLEPVPEYLPDVNANEQCMELKEG